MATLFVAHHYNNQTSTPDHPQNQTPKPLPQMKENKHTTDVKKKKGGNSIYYQLQLKTHNHSHNAINERNETKPSFFALRSKGKDAPMKSFIDALPAWGDSRDCVNIDYQKESNTVKIHSASNIEKFTFNLHRHHNKNITTHRWLFTHLNEMLHSFKMRFILWTDISQTFILWFTYVRTLKEQIIGKQLKNDQLRDNICPGSYDLKIAPKYVYKIEFAHAKVTMDSC